MDETWGTTYIDRYSQIQSGTQDDANNADVKNALSQFIVSQTGQYVTGLTKSQVISALFDENGKNLLSGPVSTGQYLVKVQIIAISPLSFTSPSSFNIIGTSYGFYGNRLLRKANSISACSPVCPTHSSWASSPHWLQLWQEWSLVESRVSSEDAKMDLCSGLQSCF